MIEELGSVVSRGKILMNEPMNRHTTFRAGGRCRYVVFPADIEELRDVIACCRRYRLFWFILGRGSNLLVSDEGIDGVAVSLAECCKELTVQGTRFYAGAGVPLPAAARFAAEQGLGGMEFASGIPGSVGGAVVMNAGAYGGEISQILNCAKIMSETGEILALTGEELQLGYRASNIRANRYTVLGAEFDLHPGERTVIFQEMEALNARRREKQPLDKASAGSTFKRPPGHFAGQLIDECGLRGFRIGDAGVSEKHCGFVVNHGHASAKEIWEVCRFVQDRVRERTGISLELEVQTVGKFE